MTQEAIEATQEAVELYRRLAKENAEAFTPDLAASLNNLGAMLGALGRREKALEATQEAVELRRRLAKENAEAFTPDLAASLNNLGNMLGALGRREKAIEAAQAGEGERWGLHARSCGVAEQPREYTQ